MNIQPPRFNVVDAERANDEWGANCGPGALAAIMAMTLDEVRPYLEAVEFASRRYTNPGMMNACLRAIGRPFRKIGAVWPSYGLVRVQWEGPWTAPGVPMRARYRHTHWIGAADMGAGDIGIFDINCINNGSGWVSLANWEALVLPWLLEDLPKWNGKWHITHAIEVEKPWLNTTTSNSL
jgi:hypothetical protein